MKNNLLLKSPERKWRSSLFLFLFLLAGFSAVGQVTTLQNWTNVYEGTSTLTQTATLSVPAGSNSNRLLVVAVASTSRTNASNTVTLSYGGRDFTLANGDLTSNSRQHTALYYLDEADLDAATSSTLSYRVQSGATVVYTGVWIAVFDNVDQGSPITNSRNRNSNTATSTFTFSSNLTIEAGDQALTVANSCTTGTTTARTFDSYPGFDIVGNVRSSYNASGSSNDIGTRMGVFTYSTVPTSNTSTNGTINLSGSSLPSMTGVSLNGCVPATVSAGAALAAICQGSPSAALGGSVGGSATGGIWTSSVSGGTFSPSATALNATWTPPAAFTGTATLTLTTTGGSCGTVSASKTLVVNPIPTAVTAAASVSTVCSGVGFNLTSSATSNNPTEVTLLDENFNATPSGWTTANNSSGGTPANAAWILRPSGYGVCQACQIPQNISSNDASQYYLSNSDAQGSGTTATILQSPTFSTVGLASATLRFFHFYRDFDTTDTAFVEISTNGSSWVALNSYTTTQGGPSAFAEVTADLAAYLNQPTVSIRFRFQASWTYYWAVDNVTVTGTAAPVATTYAWTSTPAGFTSAVQNPTGVTQTVARVYTVTATNSYGCTASASTASVALTPATVGGSVSGTGNFCSGSTSGVLTLSGHNGTIVRWESSVSPFTTWTPISNTATTYTSGPLTQDTKFRAIVSGCTEVASSEATLSLGTSTWNGTEWLGGAPSANKSVVIAGNYTSPGSGFDLRGCSLTVQNNAVVTIVPEDSVILSGPLTVAPGSTMTIESRAHLIQTGTTNTNSGTVIIKVNSAPMKRLDYTLWSSPVAGQMLQPFSPLTFANRFYTYDSNANAYAVVPNLATAPFETTKGYLIRVANNHSASQPQSWTGTFTGTPNNGNYSLPLANFGPGKRFTLIGNPYPSPIDPEAFISDPNNANSITGTLYLFRKTNGSGKPSYCTLNLGGFISNGEAHSNFVASLPRQIIQTGQGFFVEATGAGSGNVVFTNDMRVDDHTNSFMRTGATSQMTNSVERNRVWLNVTNEEGLFSQTMIGYMGNATDGVDVSYDGKYINDGAIALASMLNAEPYAIQSKGLPFAATDVVPLHFAATTAGTYTIAIDKVDGLFAQGQAVYLQDSLTGTVHNLTEGAYSFATEAGTFNSRFEVRYQSTTLGTTTPVLNENQVVIYKTPSNEISINTGNFVMDSVVIYDLAGRLLFEQKDINNSQALIKVGLATEVLLVKIKTQDGKSVTKKVLFPRTTLKKEFKTSNIQMAEDE